MSSSAVRINSLPASLFPLLTSLYLLSLLPSSRAYSWSFQSMPQQCSNLTVSITGSDGKPPYRILILPFGPSPLANNTEARTILDVPFNGQESSVSFKLKYPENSQLVAVVCYFISCSFCFLLSFGCYPSFYFAIFSFSSGHQSPTMIGFPSIDPASWSRQSMALPFFLAHTHILGGRPNPVSVGGFSNVGRVFIYPAEQPLDSADNDK